VRAREAACRSLAERCRLFVDTFASIARRATPFVFLAAVVLLLVAGIAGRAEAHAYIVDAQPAAGSTLTDAPSTISITFDEPVDLPAGPAIEVTDAAGNHVDRHDAAVDPNDATRVVVRLGAIARGTYTVHWHVVSADTHVVHGTYVFGYGVAPSGSSAGAGAAWFDPEAPLASMLRWLTFLGVAAAVGGWILAVAFRDRLEPSLERLVRRQIRVGAASAVIGSALLFVVQSMASAGGLRGGMSLAALESTLSSPFGAADCVRIGALLVLGVLATSPRRTASVLALVAVIIIPATFTLAGHAASRPAFGSQLALEFADWLHIVSISAWLGGLPLLLAALKKGSGAFVQNTLARFTVLAVPAVVLTLATGLYATLAHEPHPLLLLTTTWGVSLAVKIVLFLTLLGFGALSLRAGRTGKTRFSRPVLRVETAIATGILLLTAFLVGQSPPTCMFMPPGSRMPADMKMPPGMQMCAAFQSLPFGADRDDA
jgi:copper transport protein